MNITLEMLRACDSYEKIDARGRGSLVTFRFIRNGEVAFILKTSQITALMTSGLSLKALTKRANNGASMDELLWDGLLQSKRSGIDDDTLMSIQNYIQKHGFINYKLFRELTSKGEFLWRKLREELEAKDGYVCFMLTQPQQIHYVALDDKSAIEKMYDYSEAMGQQNNKQMAKNKAAQLNKDGTPTKKRGAVSRASRNLKYKGDDLKAAQAWFSAGPAR